MRILLLAFEIDSFAIASIAKRLEDYGHTTCIVNGDHWSFVNDKNVDGFYRQLSLNCTYNLENEFSKFQNLDKYNPDYSYLKLFEANYCTDKNIQQLMMSDHVINSWPRYPFYTPFTREMAYHWTDIRLKWLETIFETFAPHYVFSISNNYFVKNAAWQIAKAKKIKMKTLINSRIKDLYYFSDNFGFGVDTRVYKNDAYECDNYDRAKAFIGEYKKSDNRFSSYDDCATQSVQTTLSPLNVIGSFLFYVRRVSIRKVIKTQSNRYNGRKPNVMDANDSFWTEIGYYARLFINRIRYSCNIRLHFESKIPDRGSYIYYPLHMLPESSTLTLSTEYYEADLIRFLSKEMPAGKKLVVKENPMMIGERPYRWYEQLRNLPNVVLIDPLVSSRDVLSGALGVVGISGTVIFEAAMLEKPNLAFGYPEFLSCVDYVGHHETNKFMRACRNEEMAKKHINVLQYIEYVIENGLSLDYSTFFPQSAKFTATVGRISDYICQDL